MLMILAWITMPDRADDSQIMAIANPNDAEDVEILDSEEIDPLDVTVFENEAPRDSTDTTTMTVNPVPTPSLEDLSAAPDQFRLDDFGELSVPTNDLMDRVGGGLGEGLGKVRGKNARQGALEKGGGNAGSEAAVAAALKWLAQHQEADGGWSFDHQRGPCKGRCSHPGVIAPSRNGATAMALLPFLGAGHTHREGKYKETVEAGLRFLCLQMKQQRGMGDLSDAGGHLYSHGLASIALCEAYAMTNDEGLLVPAQMSLNYIVFAQDPIGGGWRYKPQQAGDTSVVGWQLMACKSGHMAYLRVPPETIMGATKFLNFVADQNGARYGYTVPGEGPATTAVGLLCRMYLGWKHDEPALQEGVKYLHALGPGPERGDQQNMYYNYYATQVMRHYGGEYWDVWNGKLRDYLVKAQDVSDGHANGSWYFPRDPWVGRGGRLYCTSLATMILEVYYRHMPIYGKQAAEDDFPL
ncbi:MAG: hypothetical protein FJ276_11775 [Planctomycetes bacterium]|nr:hypothetical protein [Planctomycetota bacterium]